MKDNALIRCAYALCLFALISSCATRKPVTTTVASAPSQTAISPPRREVREPIFRIESVAIERDLLVTTKLSLALAIDNPNDFPIELGSFSYAFYAEGKLWTEGSDADSAANAVPANASLERKLSFTMNFADMDRRLFDLVAKLKTIDYRLKGEARVSTGIESIGDFSTAFDREGSCAVER